MRIRELPSQKKFIFPFLPFSFSLHILSVFLVPYLFLKPHSRICFTNFKERDRKRETATGCLRHAPLRGRSIQLSHTGHHSTSLVFLHQSNHQQLLAEIYSPQYMVVIGRKITSIKMVQHNFWQILNTCAFCFSSFLSSSVYNAAITIYQIFELYLSLNQRTTVLHEELHAYYVILYCLSNF